MKRIKYYKTIRSLEKALIRDGYHHDKYVFTYGNIKISELRKESASLVLRDVNKINNVYNKTIFLIYGFIQYEKFLNITAKTFNEEYPQLAYLANGKCR